MASVGPQRHTEKKKSVTFTWVRVDISNGGANYILFRTKLDSTVIRLSTTDNKHIIPNNSTEYNENIST